MMNLESDLRHRFYIAWEHAEGLGGRRRIIDRVAGDREPYATAVDIAAASRICTLLNCEEDFKLMQAEAKEGRL